MENGTKATMTLTMALLLVLMGATSTVSESRLDQDIVDDWVEALLSADEQKIKDMPKNYSEVDESEQIDYAHAIIDGVLEKHSELKEKVEVETKSQEDFDEFIEDAALALKEFVFNRDNLESIGMNDIHWCENVDGNQRPFMVIDESEGNHYSVKVLQQVQPYNVDLRVSFNNQVVGDEKAATLYMTSNQNDRSWSKHDDGVGSTGTCGWGPYGTDGSVYFPANVDVELAVSGIDVSIILRNSETVTTTEESKSTFEWGITAGAKNKGGELVGHFSDKTEYGEETTAEWEAESSVIWDASRHTFKQDYVIPKFPSIPFPAGGELYLEECSEC